MMAVKLVVGLLIAFFIVTFAAENQDPVKVVYYGGFQYEGNLWIPLLASVGFGIVLTTLALGLSLIKAKGRSVSLRSKINMLEKSLKDLKQRPVPDEPGVYPPLGVVEEPKSLPQVSERRALAGRA